MNVEWIVEDENGDSPLNVPAGLEFDVHCSIQRGDERVRYYPDGSGCPGSDDEVEIHSCTCHSIVLDDGKRTPTVEEVKSLNQWLCDKLSDDESFIERVLGF